MSALEQASASPLPEGITDPNYRPPPGRLGNLTVIQQHALDTFKKQLVDEGHFVPERMDDATLLRYVFWFVHTHRPVPVCCDRWSDGGARDAHTALPRRFLRARKFDVAKTKAMLLSAEQWRKDFDVEDIVKYVATFLMVETLCRPLDSPGTLSSRKRNKSTNTTLSITTRWTRYPPSPRPTRACTRLRTLFFTPSFQDGRPVYIQRLGKIDVNAINAITTQERQLRRFVLEYEKFLTERLPACSRAVGHPVETSCTILDLAGVGVASFYRVKDYVFQAAGIGQDRYPECMGKFYIINAPWAFSTVWSIVKPWLDEVTVAKIDIVSSGTVKEKLLAQIPAENLPAEFGGKCRCVGGCSLSDAGPWNPEVGQDGEA